jgi:membrane protease YdiL (CAAX protease family)
MRSEEEAVQPALAGHLTLQPAPTAAPPDRSPTLVRWTAFDILLVVFLTSLWLGLAVQVLRATGFYEWFYGPDLVGRDGEAEASRLAQFRLNLWALALASPFQLATALLVPGALSGARPRDLGLTTRRLGTNLLAGALAAPPLTLAAYLLQELVVRLQRHFVAGGDPQKHPFEQLAQQGLRPAEWALLVFGAVGAAAVLEEVLFRGLLQPWFAARRWGGHVALAGALALAVVKCHQPILDAFPSGRAAVLQEAVPVLALGAVVPVYLLVWGRSRTPLGPALFGTAVLFGWAHAGVWPSPVPLTLLGLGLGYLAYRTRSLVGPVLVHALFNGVACAQLLFPSS